MTHKYVLKKTTTVDCLLSQEQSHAKHAVKVSHPTSNGTAFRDARSVLVVLAKNYRQNCSQVTKTSVKLLLHLSNSKDHFCDILVYIDLFHSDVKCRHTNVT